jgi:hypothetical protein
MEQFSVSKEVVCYCGRCRMDLGHTITSTLNGKPAKVICRTCRSEHIYRGKKGITEPLKQGEDVPYLKEGSGSGPTRKRVASDQPKAVPVEVEWQRQMNATNKAIQPYAADQKFAAGDKLSHPTFGMGVVQKLVYPNKVEILFQSDLKILIHKP